MIESLTNPQEFSKIEKSNIYRDMETNFEFNPENNLFTELYSASQDNGDLEEMFTEVLDTSKRYVEDICDIMELETDSETDRSKSEELAEKDRNRTILHNSLIDSINILYRHLNLLGRKSSILEKCVGKHRNAYRVLAIELIYDRIMDTQIKKHKDY
jgi:hypothetical protein